MSDPGTNEALTSQGSYRSERMLEPAPECSLRIGNAPHFGSIDRREQRLRFETLMADLSARFINLPGDQVDAEMEGAQRQVCECLHIDVSALWQISASHPRSLSLSHFSAPPGFPPVPEVMDAQESFPWCLEKLLKGESVVLSRVTDAPAAAARDLGFWRHYGLKSVLTFPLSTGGEAVFGALNFGVTRDERDWPIELVHRLHLVAEIFANALARKRADQTLRESEARYRNTFNEALVGMYRTTPHGRIMAANPALARMLGYDSAEDAVVSISDTAQQVWADPQERSHFTGVVKEQGIVRAYECQFMRRDGTKIWVSLSSRAVRGPDGQAVCFECFIEDITGRKQAEDSLRSSYAEIKALKDRIEAENAYLREEIEHVSGYGEIVGSGEAIRRVMARAQKVAGTDSTVLLLGETGTGKELLAHHIHQNSGRKNKPFVMANLAAIPATLVESELFGREKGAFTGAVARQIGRFEVADHGTIFLDEVGEMPLETQVKLLRILQTGELERLGSSTTIRVDVRVIVATNRDLAEEVRCGRFRQDLFYRMNVFPIIIPPLRDRREDIQQLVWSFVQEFSEKMGKPIDRIRKRGLEALRNHSWPGNIRELRNIIERSMIFSQGPELDIALPDIVSDTSPDGRNLKGVERRHIIDVLKQSGGKIRGPRGAAQMLGLKPTTLYSKMKKLGINRS